MNNRIMQKEIPTELSGLTDEISSFTNREELREIISDFVSLQQVYSAGIKEIRTKLEILDDEFQLHHDHNPIHHMEYRLKTPKSILEKLQKKGLSTTIEDMSTHITDIAGVRVICNYIDDIYHIASMLAKQDDITVIKRKDYIKNPKPNGYRSLHLVVEVPIFLAEKKQPIPVEIQIRTIAMDFWASLEHNLKYKTDSDVPPEIKEELLACATTITELDNKMQNIHTKLGGNSPKPKVVNLKPFL